MAQIPLDANASVIILEVLLKGAKDSRMIKMILDTGATLTTVPPETALGVGCDPSRPKRRIEMITASGTEYVPVIVIPKITFLGFELRNIEAACLSLPPKAMVAGLLGLNVLGAFDVLLAFRKKLLEITR